MFRNCLNVLMTNIFLILIFSVHLNLVCFTEHTYLKIKAALKVAKAIELHEYADNNDESVRLGLVSYLKDILKEIIDDIDIDDDADEDDEQIDEQENIQIDAQDDDEDQERAAFEKSKHQEQTVESLLVAIDHCYYGFRQKVVDWSEQKVVIDRAHPVCRSLKNAYFILRDQVNR